MIHIPNIQGICTNKFEGGWVIGEVKCLFVLWVFLMGVSFKKKKKTETAYLGEFFSSEPKRPIVSGPDKKGQQGLFRDNYPYFSIKTYFVTRHRTISLRQF